MPNYNAQVPPYSIFSGDVALAFNSEAPAAGQASQQFALPSYAEFRRTAAQSAASAAPQNSPRRK
jgi:hypothetical protein